jgi:glucose-6-phosphate isomerase
VEAGKKAAVEVLQLQQRVLAALPAAPGADAAQIAAQLGADAEEVYHVLQHAAANDSAVGSSGDAPAAGRFFRT